MQQTSTKLFLNNSDLKLNLKFSVTQLISKINLWTYKVFGPSTTSIHTEYYLVIKSPEQHFEESKMKAHKLHYN